jgi:hypothetical protein
MNRIDHHPGRGSRSSCRARKTPVNVTPAAVSQMIAPRARTHGVAPRNSTTTPAMATATPTKPARSAQTAILHRPFRWGSAGSFT